MAYQTESLLPIAKVDWRGKRRVDYRGILLLAFPLFLSNGVQAVLNLTDSWFIGRLSTDAIAAMGALYFLILVLFVLFGGVGMYVQTLVAQAYGEGKYHQAAQAVGAGFWGALLLTPLFVLLAISGVKLLKLFQFSPVVEQLAIDYWIPRLLGLTIAIINLGLTAFFNGVGRTTITLWVSIAIALLNVVLNESLMFQLGMGMAGAAWATTLSLMAGMVLFLWVFLSREIRQDFQSHRIWKPQWQAIRYLFAVGLPLGFLMTADLTGIAFFQIMQVKLGVVPGAATQVVMMLTSTAYMPTLGIAQAGTTLVGQSIGAGNRRWAKRLGNIAIALCVLYSISVNVLLAFNGQWLVPLFVTTTDAHVEAVIQLSQTLLWLAVVYNAFNALNIGSAFCLQGTGDVKVPSLFAVLLSWLGFVPLTHILTFEQGEGLVDFLPQLGVGIFGGWSAAILFTLLLSSFLFLRWRFGGWQKTSSR
ncbi:MATE family efflux transporter [Leptolyngbyaceae cyanobacterium CCMR0082]|uniref:Probable multidrug resistance protein NorM n=1 Tax=Adonisia turfae CCMR0082 TaxID=2304604 RepID=A0A6M0SE07_9CYAN|nr:MATE family efflux transporter [Adonisia turfae]NEZ66293.1 MATE family efflux transporter [Adonisia turfae CCMR0082]